MNRETKKEIIAVFFLSVLGFALEQFLSDCRKTKIKKLKKLLLLSITKDADQSIAQSKLDVITRGAGKLARASHDWFWFDF